MQDRKNNTRDSSAEGFTLVEMMVSLAIFAVVAVVAAGALLRIMDANKKAQSIQSAITNLNFALESMSREMRVGSKYQCGTGSIDVDGYNMNLTAGSNPNRECNEVPNSNGSYIAFISSAQAIDPATGQPCTNNHYNLAYEYRFVPISGTSNYSLEKAEQPQPTAVQGCSSSSYSTVNDGGFTPVISTSNVTITGYRITATYDSLDQQYPLAVIRISGYTGVREKDRTYFNVVTAASARLP